MANYYVKLPSGSGGGGAGITQLIGDVTAIGPGIATATLTATSNSTLVALPDLATVGTITSGTWQGTPIGQAYGGTGVGYTVPLAASFQWDNQPTGSTFSDTSTGLQLYMPQNATDVFAVLTPTAAYPSTPFTLTVGMNATIIGADYMQAGILIRDPSGKAVTLSIAYAGGSVIQYAHYTNYSSYSSSPALEPMTTPIRFFVFQDDGTNITAYVGSDLNGLTQFYQESRTAWLSAPTHIGLFVDAGGGPLFSAKSVFFHYKIS